MHNDEPVLCDELERAALIAEVGDAIATCVPPQVFGLHGDWGLGKTSFLQQVHYYLTGDCPEQSDAQVDAANFAVSDHKGKVAVVWFEAWRYQNEAAPIVALLHEMRAQLSWNIKLLEKTGKLVNVAIRGALMSFEGLTKLIGVQASKVQEAGEKWEADHLAAALPSHTLREQLEAAIEGLINPQLTPVAASNASQSEPQPPRRVVVLIDDLDRCQPAAAYRLLEGLKIYLTLPNCVFLLGMNQQVVEEAIAKEVPVPDADDCAALRAERAAAYLEKLCQNVWRVPAVRDPKAFLLKKLADDEPLRDWIAHALDNLECLPPNPRRLKGFANLLQRFKAVLPQLPGAFDADDSNTLREIKVMLIVAYVYQFHHGLFRFWEFKVREVTEEMMKWARGEWPRLTQSPSEPEDADQRIPPFFELLDRLHPNLPYIAAPINNEPAYRRRWAIADPANANVFWLYPLLAELAAGETVTSVDFKRYLHGNPAQGGA